VHDVAPFAQALQHLRHAARLTQAELAERSGLSEREISDLERGLRKSPQRATVRLLIEALGLAPDQAEAFELAARETPPLKESVARRPANNLPAERSSFVGRRDEVARLQRLLDPRGVATTTRLVTLTGTGGCGKTRLAIQVARGVVNEFPDGVWFVDLSPITDASPLATVVLDAIGGRESSDLTPDESLTRLIRGWNSLLILDNCEHMIDASAAIIDALLDTSPGLRVLATTREALRVPGEVAWHVPSLDTPEVGASVHAHDMLEYAAVRLFCQRVSQVEPDFSLNAENAAAVAHICRRLDGIPLALELAAARAAALSVQDIAERLDDCFRLLTSGSRTALERHRTLRATIDWSHDLLSPTEQTLFRRLSVFADGWTVETAQTVCEGDMLPRSEVLDTLMRLIDQSLVHTYRVDGRTRYRFLETIRMYAAERLQAAGETSWVRARHREWCLVLAEQAGEGLEGPDQFRWLRVLAAEHDNIRAALEGCALDPSTTETQLRLVAAMSRFWYSRQRDEGRRRLAAALDRAQNAPGAARADALTWQAVFEFSSGNPAIGGDLVRQALADARAVGDSRTAIRALRVTALATDDDRIADRVQLLEEALALARADGGAGRLAAHLAWLAAAVADTGDFDRARVLAEESEAFGRESGDSWRRLMPIVQLGWLAVARNDLAEAEWRFRTAVDLATEWGGFYIGLGLFGLAHVRLRCRDHQQARALCRQGLLAVREISPGSVFLVDGLAYTASVDAGLGHDERAQRLMGAHEGWYDAHGGVARLWRPDWSLLALGLVLLPPTPSDPTLARARAEGRAMSLDEALACALEPVEAAQHANE
jgi:predicted ATPase/transcriptional regulator with XRE-family HTH domain